MKRLVAEFEANGGKIEKINAGKFFYVKSNPQLNKDSFNFSKNGSYPYFTRTVLNNGILGYVDYLDEEHKIPGNCIAVGMLGMKFFYMEHDFYAGQFTKTIVPLFTNFSHRISLYFISQFNKYSEYYLTGLVRDFEKLFTMSEIYVPIKKAKLDLNFIENYIEILEDEQICELEKKKIDLLEKYLQVSGLDNYELTEEEQKAIDLINSNKIKFKDFIIKDIFDISTGKDFIIGNSEKGNIPLVSHTNSDNGISIYVKQQKNKRLFNAKNTLALADRGVFYATTQDKNFHIGTRVKALTFKSGEMSEEKRLFFTTTINKLQIFFTEYLVNATDSLPDLKIKLPINYEGEIDYEFMNTYIKAIEKLVIKNVVDWKDKIIKTTKDVCNK